MSITKCIAGLVTSIAVLGGPALAGSCGYERCYGAVGFGPGGAWGYSYGQWSEDDAYQQAQEGCGWDCTVIKTFYNTCGAIAVGNTDGHGWAIEPTRERAEYMAMQYCHNYDSGCQIRAWACSK